MVGVERGQLGDRLSPAAARVLLEVPRRRGDLRQEMLSLLHIRDELVVQVVRAPVQQHAADVEDHAVDAPDAHDRNPTEPGFPDTLQAGGGPKSWRTTRRSRRPERSLSLAA